MPRHHPAPYFGPHSANDPEIQGLLKTKALQVINKRIKERLTELAPAVPSEKHSPHRRGHEETKARLCLVGEVDKASRWFQLCLTCKGGDRRKAPKVHFISDPLNPVFLTGNSELAMWFKIRDEITRFNPRQSQGIATQIAPAPAQHRHIPAPIQAQPVAGPAIRVPSPPPLAPPEENLFSELDLSFPVELTVYIIPDTDRTRTIIEETIYARHDSCVRLSDFKLLLGSTGLQQEGALEVYDFFRNVWVPCRWDTPHFIPIRSEAMLNIRYEGLAAL
ncbi:hypothetical protein BDZ97DRAFT_1763180 [Flammula alnicola]|nr:hypothetical protein BDZ97DRAFT_1763180 [Flammula alnicola]